MKYLIMFFVLILISCSPHSNVRPNGIYKQLTTGECYSCKGIGRKDCGYCDGTGLGSMCLSCDGAGRVSYLGVWQKCYSCGGRGYYKCYTCKGKGWVKCNWCNGTGYVDR